MKEKSKPTKISEVARGISRTDSYRDILASVFAVVLAFTIGAIIIFAMGNLLWKLMVHYSD